MTNYQIIEKIYESANSLVYRATLKPDNKPIILKILKENYPTPSELTRYKQEYEITHSLNVDSIIKAYELKRYENSLVILLEDFGGQSLKILISQGKLCLEEFISIAIKTTESLGAIHTANIIHKDINPSNIVYNPQTGQLKIIDFGISTRLSQEFMTVCPLNQLEGTLAYIAPEQTGRMNRGIDYRSDFYSLGVTFYELLTNKLPFKTTDLMELVHCHIAQQPLAVHELIPDIPLAVSDIISKLLAKTPEHRYQSAWGIKADLETCLNQLNTRRKISQFPLGSQDIAEKFHIPQKLYGREQEVNQLLTAFEEVSQGTTGMILISGYSGIGKSTLVNEIHKQITRQRGQFISGKFDQLKRDIPYAAISQAFQDLIHRLLSEPEITLQNWKNKILKALGNNGQIIIDMIPEVEKIIGEQPPIEHIIGTENQDIFNLFIQNFLDIFCQKEYPLVMFLDDLQWADLPSLKLIEQLVSDPDNKYFLIIGAYRDHEVSPTHPLVHTLNKINQAKIPVNEITLYPLKIQHINQLIADTLSCSTEVSKPLAELVAKKTGGNPFFLNQLLYSLYQEKLLVFNYHQSFLNPANNQQGYWQWNIEQIESVSITDNIVDLMVSKIAKLDQKTQKILKIAACIGNNFNLEILSIVNNKSQIFTARELQSAIDEGLIIPLDNNYKFPLLCHPEDLSNQLSETPSEYYTYIPYKFLHDRVQQAAYSLIPESEKRQVHLQIGRLLLQNLKENELQNKIFYIVNQLNEGSALINEQLEKDELAKLNLQAGKKAKTSTAYEIAWKYLDTGLKLLARNSWSYQYKLTFEIHREKLEILYLNAKYEKVEQKSVLLLEQAKEVLDKISVYELKILCYNAKMEQNKAIQTALIALEELEINRLGKIEINDIETSIKKSIELLLEQTKIENLTNLPPMRDKYKLKAVEILQKIMFSTITTNFPLHIEVILTQILLFIKYGNSPQAAAAYSYYGMLLCSIMNNIDLGYKIGKISIKLLQNLTIPKSEISKLEPIVKLLYYGFIWYWKEWLKKEEELKKIIDGIQEGIDSGNKNFAAMVAISYCLIKFFGGYNLEEVDKDSLKYRQLIYLLQQKYSLLYIDICHKIITYLIDAQGDINNKQYYFIGDNEKQEEQYFQSWQESNNEWLLFIAYFAKQLLNYLFKNYNDAVYECIQAQKYINSCRAYLPASQYIFYSSLTLIAYYINNDLEQTEELLEQVDKNQEDMKLWAGHCPENFQHKYDLVEAEKARLLGQNWQAEELYEQAIQGAKKYEFIHEEALAYERAAEFYLALGREEIGKLYLRNAHHCYSRWGAKAKVKQLESEYPQYLLRVTNKSKSKELSTTISTNGIDGEILDLTTVIKASQAISGEIKLKNLLQNLMKIVIENAGAQKAFLILNDQGNWVIEAQVTVDSDQVTILQSIPIVFIDPDKSIPILPNTIINYVIHTQEHIVLNEAIHEGQFVNDPYIIATRTKSILCTPLVNQGQLRGIVYLENNLTTGAFTSERVELLNILSAQAAISIDNSRLYQTLEQRVEERTKELSQTLGVLKATQAELIFENNLLRSTEQTSTFDYQVGGSLSINSPTYVVRSADRNLYKALKQGEFCYTLNARQMGKSSLMVRMMHHLQHEEFSCAAIDMTRIGSENVTPEQWYKGFAVELWRSFGLPNKVNLKTWWNERKDISPVQRLSQFIE